MHISKNAKIVIAGLMAVLVACGIGFSDNIFKSNAASELKSLSTLEKTEQISDNTELPSEYTFYPDIQRATDGTQITKATPFGEWDYTNRDTVEDGTEAPIKGIANIVWIDKDDHSYDGKIGMTYDNVGSYNGHTISLKVTYMGNSENSTSNGFGLIMYNNSLGIRTSASPSAVTIKYEFLDAETGKAISVKGYQGFQDIDAYQGLKIDNYDKIYYSTNALDNLKVANYGGNLNNLIQSTIENITDDPDNIAKIAYTFSGSEVTFTWTTSLCYYQNLYPDKVFSLARCYKGLDKDASIKQALATYYYVDTAGNICDPTTEGATKRSAVLTLNANSDKVIPSETKNPLKTISDSKGDSVTKDIYTKTDKIYFSLIHEVPGEISNNYYKSYVLTDKLDPAFSIKREDVKIYNDATKNDVSSLFNISIVETNGQYVVSATAKASTLASESFYTTAYNMVMGVTVKDGYDLTDYYTNGYYNVSNIGNVLVNGKEKDSNDTTVKITEFPILSIEKSSDKTSYDVGETANYTVKVTQKTKNATAKNVVISDTLDNNQVDLVANSIVIKDKNGNNVDTAQITTNGNSYSIKTNANLAYNEYYTIAYKVKLTNKELAGASIINTATTKADNADEVNTTSKINVNIPVEKTPLLTINKKVNNTAFSLGDTANYTLKVTQTVEDAIAKNVVITDTFDTSLVKPENIKIINSKGLDVTTAEIISTENGFKIKTNADLSKDEYFTVTYSASLAKEKLTENAINNIAKANADNASEVKDNAKITVAKPELSITKRVNKTKFATGETATYTLKVMQTVDGAIARNVVITDTMDTNLVSASELSITDMNGKPLQNTTMINNPLINGTTTNSAYTIHTNANLAKGEYFLVTYKVNLANVKLSGSTLTNVANAAADNASKVEDSAKIMVVKPELSITKKADKTNYSLGDTVNYTLKVTQTAQNAAAKNVVITDTFDTNLLNVENIKIKDMKGNVVPNAVITKTEKGFTIQTNADLTKDEFFTVTYSATITNNKLSGTSVNNLATAKGDNVSEVKDNEKINVLKPELVIKKSVNKENYALDESAKYTVKVTQTVKDAVAKNVVITDTFDKTGMTAKDFKVTDKDGNVLSNAKITPSEKGFTIQTNTNLAKDEYIIVTYTVALTDDTLVGTSVNNLATAKGDNADEVKDNAKITLPKPVLTIKKNVNKTNYSLGDKVNYTLTVTQTVKNAIAKNVVITDTMDTNLTKAENIKITDKDGKALQNAVITPSEKGFTIQTNANLAKDETFTVVYTLTLTDKTLSGKSINNLATAKGDHTDEVKDNAKITIVEPKLEIEKKVNKTTFSTNDKATYTLKVTQTAENAVAKNVVITDTMDTDLAQAENIKITDKNGNTVNAADIVTTEKGFSINTNTNLEQNEFFTVTYTVLLSNAKLSGTNVNNIATAKGDNADEVKDQKEITVTKPILAIQKESDKKIYSTGEIAKYTLKITQTEENAVAKNVVITDKFDNENITKPTNIKVLDSKGNAVSNAEVTVTDTGFTINTNSNLAKDEFFTVTYNVSMSSPVLSGKEIVNTAVTSAENADEVTASNTVTVTTPELTIKKDVNKTAFSSSETAKYTLTVTQVAENAVAKNVVITDKFDNKDIAKPTNVKITDSKGNVVSAADIAVTDIGFTINTNADLAKDEFFTVTYTVKLSNPALTGATINNVANAKADNAKQVEDKATITIGKPDLTVTKTSNKDTYGTDENANYTIKVTQTVKDASAQNVVITDSFDNKDASILADTIKVKDKDGNVIENAQIEKTETGYIIKTFTDLNYNESLTVTYTVNLANDLLAGKTIKNTATVTTDNTPEKKVDRTIKIVEPILNVKKTSDQAAYLLGSTAKYTVKVTQTTKDAIAKNIVIYDELSNKSSKIIADSIKIVDSKGNAVSGVKIETAGNTIYKITTNKNLAYNESFTVTYNVELKDESLNNTDLNNTVRVSAENTKVVKVNHIVKISKDKTVVNQINKEAREKGIIQTGNKLPIPFFGIIAIVSLIGIITAFIIKRRH